MGDTEHSRHWSCLVCKGLWSEQLCLFDVQLSIHFANVHVESLVVCIVNKMLDVGMV